MSTQETELGQSYIHRAVDQRGHSLAELSADSLVLLVFLRHFGCIFCNTMLSTLQRGQETLRQGGLRLVLVHQGTDSEAQRKLERYGLQNAPRISDPRRELYRAFGLREGRLSDLLGWPVVLAAFKALLAGQGINRLGRGATQMPGVFILHEGKVVKSFDQKHVADAPSLDDMAAKPE